MMMKHNGNRAPEEIQAEIERTRSDLDETLSAIERRLTPGQLVDQGLDYLKGSGAKQYVERLGESVKQDPIPLALVAVGLAWLMMSDRRSRLHSTAPAHDTSASIRDTASSMASSASSMASSVASSVTSMKDKVSGKVSQTSRRLSDTAYAARERASRAAESARMQSERVRSGYHHLVEEQPLALGAIGLAVGALLGGMTPRTRQEERLAEGIKERFVDEPTVADGGEPIVEDLSPLAGAATLDETRVPDTTYPETSADKDAKPFVAPYVPPSV